MDSFSDKQPYEEYYVDFDFSNVVVSPDTIATAAVTAVDDHNNNAITVITTAIKQNIDTALSKVYVWVQGGVSGTMYYLTCKIITANGEKYEKDGEIYVKEIN